MPAHASAQVEDVSRLIRLVPAFGQVGLDGESARGHPGAHLVAQEPAVDEAERVVRLAAQNQMRVEVGRIVAPYAENSPTLGLLGPAHAWPKDGLGRQHRTGGEARFQEVATWQPLGQLPMA
jgi:hypothetical protein